MKNPRVFYSKQGNKIMRRPRPTEMKIQSTKDQTLHTGFETYNLTEGEVFKGKFKNRQQIDSLIEIGVLRKIAPNVPIKKPVPVILEDSSGETLPLQNLPSGETFLPFMSEDSNPPIISDSKTEEMKSVKVLERSEPYSRQEMDMMLSR
jgi:hypothetical protein